MSTFSEDAENVYNRDQLLKTYATLDANSVTAKMLLAEVGRLSSIIDINTTLAALSKGRLLADNETPFTAEQVNDIRTVVFRALHSEDEVVQACRRLESALLQMDQGTGKGHPIPTETGPWPSLKDVPAEVPEVRDVGENLWRRKGGNWEWKTADGRWFEVFNPRAANDLAPFVAAEEG